MQILMIQKENTTFKRILNKILTSFLSSLGQFDLACDSEVKRMYLLAKSV